jgi:hypothetical protein
MLSCKVDEARKVLIITVDLQEPTPSASGKTLVVATTHGNQASGINVQGKALIVGVNAYLRK